jgi:hypothetical protein
VPPAPTLEEGHLVRVVALSDGYAAVGCRWAKPPGEGETCAGPAVWLSPDALRWGDRIDLALAPGEESGIASDVDVGPGGYVVGGHTQRGAESRAAIWHSSDGTQFNRVGGGDAFERTAVTAITVWGSTWSAIGSGAFLEAAGFRSWSSADGQSWTAGADDNEAEAFPFAVLVSDTGLLAFGPSCGVCVPETHWWSSADGVTWSADGSAPGLDRVALQAATHTPNGLVAAGSAQDEAGEAMGGVWQRPLGADAWSPAPAPVLPAGASLGALISIGDGLLGAATVSRRTQFSTLLMTKPPDQERWLPVAEFSDHHLVDLVQDRQEPRRVFAIGHSGVDGAGPVVTWVGGVDWAP